MARTYPITCVIIFFLWMNGFVPHRAVLGQILQNVALHKPARQSSTVLGAQASYVVDGNLVQDFHEQLCCHTNAELNPYWEVDLGQTFLIHHIQIYNRVDCCSDRVHDVQIMITNGEETTNVCFHAGRLPDIFLCQPDVPMYGRTVRVQLMRDRIDILHICEVLVMAGNRGPYAPIPLARGLGLLILEKSVRSRVACIAHCSHNADCASVNIVRGANGIECHLLGDDTSISTEEENIEFWKINALTISPSTVTTE